MKLSGLSHLLVEQIAVAAAILAYLTGIVTVRPHPSPPDDMIMSIETPTRLVFIETSFSM